MNETSRSRLETKSQKNTFPFRGATKSGWKKDLKTWNYQGIEKSVLYIALICL